MNMKTLKKVTAGAVLATSFGVAAPLAGAHGFGNDHNRHGHGPEHHQSGNWQHGFEKGKFAPGNLLQKLEEGDQFGNLTVTSVETEESATVAQLDGDVNVKGYYDAESGTFQVVSIDKEQFMNEEKPRFFKALKHKDVTVDITNGEEAAALFEGNEGLEPSEVTLSNIQLTAEGKEIAISAEVSGSNEETAAEQPGQNAEPLQ